MVHDACGVGFIARAAVGADESQERRIVALGLEALRRLTHRGASAEFGAVDGCGVLTDIPWALIDDAMAGLRPIGRTRALGMLFVHPADRAAAAALVEQELAAAGASSCGWRVLATHRLSVLRGQRHTTPKVLQVAAAFGDGQKAVESALYRARLRIENAARVAGIRLTIASLSTRTVVYKALVTPQALDTFYPDLANAKFTSRFIVFHQRFSTNTTADWALAQPFRSLAHNGEINTINGNRSWMRARLADATALPGFAQDQAISTDGSDSKTLDDAIELMRHQGYSTAHALARFVPPAWERDHDMPPDVRAFYEFQSLLSEPWDGPSALVYADGRHVGAAMDRNGFRPARVVTTAEGLIAVASEAGVLPAHEHEIVNRSRLGPGDMIDLDLERGIVRGTNDLRRQLAFRRRYRRLVEDIVVPLAPRVDATAGPCPADAASLSERQAAFGCSREEVDVILRAMIAGGHEAVGSMGDDTPPAVLSARPRLFSDFFRQRFAQVTNPPVDPYREASVMSLTTMLGAHGAFVDELAPRPPRLALRSPILTERQLTDLRSAAAFEPVTIATLFDVATGADGVRLRLDAISEEVCAAVERGSAVVVLTDRGVSAARAPVPALLAVAGAHHALVRRGLRMRASLVVESGDARDPHQIALLCAFGASAVCPSLAYEVVAGLAADDDTGCDLGRTRYRLAVERGLRTIMSKMGVCTFSGYCGAQLFEILGLDAAVVDEFFPGTASPIGGLSLSDVAATIVERHRRAFCLPAAAAEYPGLHGYRRDGEYHATNPIVVRSLQRARDEAIGNATDRSAAEPATAYDTFKSHVYRRPPSAIRDLLTFASAAPIPIADVEPESSICRRFFASAMSVGALSPEAHRTIAEAMNRLGGRSNSGEGGEEPDRFGRPDGNRTKQVASARFGVTPGYLRSADELQIKIAQGSKPGEGGQLPAMKVVPHIARLRHAQPGTTLISPPVHHDIYSIEDLAELIYDLRAFHPTARINVKLVASAGVGIIAAGVAKAGAGAIQISGHDGGTGASPRASIKHAGMPWEIGLSEAHRVLTAAGLRDRVVLQTDGGLKTGRDIAMAAALGADEYGFGTAALVSIGCVMARQCHMNTCPVGIATQRDDLRGAFNGTPEMLIGYLRLVAGEVREILASLGLARLSDLVGRTDLLRARENVSVPVVLEPLLRRSRRRKRARDRSTSSSLLHRADSGSPLDDLANVGPTSPLVVVGPIANTDRAFGAAVAGAIAARHGDAGLPEGSVRMTMTGSAGQSFGAFSVPGMQLTVVGDANDGLGKGMHGGELIVAPAARERGRIGQVLVGNAALYGATGGRVFIAGAAGERFAIRNSGGTAVVEGVGDHACEYMTGGTVVILGPVGRNFAAGMTGGVAYVTDERHLSARTHPEQLSVEPLAPADLRIVRDLLETHARLTGSRAARMMLRNDRSLSAFRRVTSAAAPAVQVTVDAEAPAVNQ